MRPEAMTDEVTGCQQTITGVFFLCRHKQNKNNRHYRSGGVFVEKREDPHPCFHSTAGLSIHPFIK